MLEKMGQVCAANRSVRLTARASPEDPQCQPFAGFFCQQLPFCLSYLESEIRRSLFSLLRRCQPLKDTDGSGTPPISLLPVVVDEFQV